MTQPVETDAASSGEGIQMALAQARFAWSRVPAFREHFGRAGLTGSDFSAAEIWPRVPCTSKEFYRRNFPSGILAEGVRLSDPGIYLSLSSGTSGDRLTTAAHRMDLARRMGATLEINPDIEERLLRPCRRICRYAAPNCSAVECATPFTTMADRLLPDGTLVLPVSHDLLATPSRMLRQAVTESCAYRPHWLYTDPNHLRFLAAQPCARPLMALPLEAIVLTYSMVTRACKAQLRRMFDGVPVVEVLSMSELGWIGMECPEGSVHLNEETFYAELLPPDPPVEDAELPVALGELRELVITSLDDTVLPHIRYRTGDVYRLLPACPCGHPSRVVRYEGRVGQHARVGLEVLTPRAVDDLVGELPELLLYQAQPDRRSLTLDVVLRPDGWERFEDDACAERISARLGDGADVLLRRCSHLATSPSGKFSNWRSAPRAGTSYAAGER